jgi:hypothetical protein
MRRQKVQQKQDLTELDPIKKMLLPVKFLLVTQKIAQDNNLDTIAPS